MRRDARHTGPRCGRASRRQDNGQRARGGQARRSHKTHQKVVATLLSPARLAPYLRAANGNLRTALKLYQWNGEMSAAVYKMLHLVEVFLRNAIDAELRIWNTTQTNPLTGRPHGPDWLLDPSRLVERIVRRQEIDKAIRRATLAVKDASTGPRPVTHDDVLAQLMTGSETAWPTWSRCCQAAQS